MFRYCNWQEDEGSLLEECSICGDLTYKLPLAENDIFSATEACTPSSHNWTPSAKKKKRKEKNFKWKLKWVRKWNCLSSSVAECQPRCWGYQLRFPAWAFVIFFFVSAKALPPISFLISLRPFFWKVFVNDRAWLLDSISCLKSLPFVLTRVVFPHRIVLDTKRAK